MPTIDKALGLLDHFSSTSPEIGLSELRGLSGFDKGTVHRYLSNLRDCGFVEQNAKTKAYRLGPALLRLAAVREKTVPLEKIASPLLSALATNTGELVHAALPQRQGMSTLFATDGGHRGIRVRFDPAELLPFHATSSGIALLAFGSQQFSSQALGDSLPAFTETTSSTTDQVNVLIERAQRIGYAFADQSYEREVCSIAVPFYSTTESAIGTVAIATPAARMNKATHRDFAVALTDTSRSLSKDLGGCIPSDLSKIWNCL